MIQEPESSAVWQWGVGILATTAAYVQRKFSMQDESIAEVRERLSSIEGKLDLILKIHDRREHDRTR